MLKRIAGSTNTYAGDGTTTASVLSREILKRGIQAVEFQGAHPIAIKRGLDIGLSVVLKYLTEASMPVTQSSELEALCNISSNYNPIVAEVVA
jgi:chaperonin GroEL